MFSSYKENQQKQAIASIFARFYQQLLGETGGSRQKEHPRFLALGHTLKVEQQVDMLMNYSIKDVKDNIFSINSNKTAGPDNIIVISSLRFAFNR